MTREENIRAIIECNFSQTDADIRETAIKNIVKLLQSENEFISSAEDYRLRLIQIFHNTHCEEFISFMVLPTESDLNMLEDMLREHYKDAEPCEDAISRKDLYNALYDRFHDEDSPNNITEVTLGSVRNFVKDFPSVTPKPKTGHWIKYGIPRCGEQHYKCTNCDEYFNFGLYSDYYKKAFKFCPNCGAEMKSEE